MKRIQLFTALFIFLLLSAKSYCQVTTLVCNDQVLIPLDVNCTHTISAGSILEGGPYHPYDYYTVELDKVPPYGNGPWIPAVVETADLGNTYIVRVTDPATGNSCWGNVTVGTHLDCSGLANVELDAGGTAQLTPAGVQVTVADNCVASNPMTVTKLNGQSTLMIDCDDLGVQTLQLTASDQMGRTSVCKVPLVVADPLGACNDCVVCPPFQTVSFEQAIEVLLPAVQAENFAPFEPYGDATYNGACAIDDSIYWVTYHPSALNQSWFERHWKVLDAGGEILGECTQAIVFDFNHTITVSGIVYADTLENCIPDAGEQGIDFLNVVATKWPSNQKITQKPNADGSYTIILQTNGLDSAVVVQIELPAGTSTPCPTTLAFLATDTTGHYEQDFGLRTSLFCPDLFVSLEAPLLRRCVKNTYYVQYCNSGLAPVNDAYITIELDTLLELTSSEIPWSNQTGNTYTFPVGNLPPLHCNTFFFKAELNCDAVLGQTICAEANIFPNTFCNGMWDGPRVEASARCTGDSVQLAIWNTGTKDMTEALNFIVIEDVIMYRQGTFQLDAGDSMTFTMPANGATWRIEAEQTPGYPLADAPSATIEGCGGLNTPGLVNAFPSNDGPAFVDIECEAVIGSFDPNDKAAIPTGYGSDQLIRKNTDLEYKIRFQNTGTDTAFRVVIVDTLSALLDHASLEAGASSHRYRLDVYPGGILHFVFDPIALPDSNVNEAGSHGFVVFRIAQQPGLQDGLEILNSAAIYFDFNDPVITNTVRHTIGEPFIILNAGNPASPGVTVELLPNPFHDVATLRLQGKSLKQGTLSLYDSQGQLAKTLYFEGNQCKIERGVLRSGIYFFQVRENGAPVAGGKLQVH